MAISREEIQHVADLARLDLDEAEIGEYGEELSSILGYISQLNELDTRKVEPTAQVSGLDNVWRPDDIQVWPADEVDAALAQGQTEGGQIKVKRVL